MWAVVLLQGYVLCLVTVALLAIVLNALEGDEWVIADKGASISAKGQSAMDECFWFTFMTLHGIGFGEFLPRRTLGHFIAALTIMLSYWFMIFMAGIVLMSQLPGIKSPNLPTILSQMVNVVWPSYAVFVALIVIVGSCMGPEISDAPYMPRSSNNYGTGIYWMWCVMHRAPYGDIWPDTPFGRTITVPAAIISYLYPPYVLAVIAVRRPSSAEHSQLLEHISMHPEEAMGPGYIAPPTGREVQMSAGGGF
jgi:hypothetical protein